MVSGSTRLYAASNCLAELHDTTSTVAVNLEIRYVSGEQQSLIIIDAHKIYVVIEEGLPLTCLASCILNRT